MTDATLSCDGKGDGLLLSRAGLDDIDKVVALQKAAYARNRELLGLEPLPLLVDYNEIFANHEVWVARTGEAIRAALIVELRPDDLLIFSVSSEPGQQGRGLGGALLAAAEVRARETGRSVIRLYTGSTLQHLIDWYSRHGFAVEQIEELEDRAIAHMAKELA